jgi:DNA repair protein RecO (recombination protein O)
MRSFKTEGIIIKRINYGEADRILTVFTRDQGKISVKASGIRRIASRRSPHVELLNHAELSLYRGHKYPILNEAQTINNYSEIKGDLTRVGLAYHICELIDGLCPENQDNASVFGLLQQVLEQLGAQENPVEIIHGFEVELLTLLGFWNRQQTVENINTHIYIENILERKLKARKIFSKLQ